VAPCREQSGPFVLAATDPDLSDGVHRWQHRHDRSARLQTGLGASFTSLQWVTNAYTLLLGGLILIGGAAGDRSVGGASF